MAEMTTSAALEGNTSGLEGEKKVVTSAVKDKDVLQWDSEGCLLLFSSDDFKELNDAFLADLRHVNRQNYFKARATARGEETERAAVVVHNPTTDVYTNRLKLPKRRGWHRVWVDETTVEGFQDLGYSVVMKKKADGRSKGVPYRIEERNANGSKSELVAMEVPQHVYEGHMRAKKLTNAQSVDYTTQAFKRAVEEHNSLYGGGGKEAFARAGVVDPDDEFAPIEE